MVKRARVFLAVVVAIGFVLVPKPAAADHAPPGWHWGHGYRPWVSAPDSTMWAYTSYAEDQWTRNGGFSRGFVTGAAAPNMPCDRHVHYGGLVVCWVPKGDPLLPAGFAGYSFIYDNGSNDPGHLGAVYTVVCADCVFTVETQEKRKRIFTHEYGHGLAFNQVGVANTGGPGHTATSTCVMYSPNTAKVPCAHDRSALIATYNHAA